MKDYPPPRPKARYVPGKPKRSTAPKVNARPNQIAWLRRLDRKQKAARIRKLYGFPGVKPKPPKAGEKGSSAVRPTGDQKPRKTPKQLEAEQKRAARSHAKGKHEKGGQKYAGEQHGRQQHISREIQRSRQPDPVAPKKPETPYDGGDAKRGTTYKVPPTSSREAWLLRHAKAKSDGKKKAVKHLRDSFGRTPAKQAGEKASNELAKAAAKSGGQITASAVAKAARVGGPVGAVVGLLLGSDPLEAATFVPTDKAGGGAGPAPKNSKKVKYAKDARKNYVLGKRDHERRRRAGVKKNPLARYARGD